MSSVPSHFQLQVPATLKSQLLDFRRKVWTTKLLEAAGIGAFSLSAAFLGVFALDRLYDTPFAVRALAFAIALAGCMVAPFYLHRWIWRNRRLENLARLLSHKMPRIGDQLLGIIELAGSPTEQARSRTLCKAAIEPLQKIPCIAIFARQRRILAIGFGVCFSATTVIAAAFLFVLFPAAAFSSFDRFIAPWSATPRYTFTAIEPFASTIIVPHGEGFTIVARLNTETTRWHPERGYARLGDHEPIVAALEDGLYKFELPSQIEPGLLSFSIGDWTQQVQTEPKLRPELTALVGTVKLPEYLGRPELTQSDVRGGSISVVKGSEASFLATISRALSSAQVDGDVAVPKGDTIASQPRTIDDSNSLEFQWRDEYGLAGKNPFKLAIAARDDEAPTLACENLPRAKVVLDTEQLVFQVKAHDDFGVKSVGMVWKGVADELVTTPAKGESPLGLGGHDQTDLQLSGTFTAKSLGIEPQEIRLRIYAEDYFPGRERVLSTPYRLFVMNAEQHAIWITEQLSRWHRQALEVRDREMQLYETNKQLRALSADELDTPDARRRLENQANAEKANGRRLANLLATSGTNLLREAARNPEIGADNLEAWAQMLGILKDIAGNRMPSVADLLKQASAAPKRSGVNAPGEEWSNCRASLNTQGSGAPPKTEGDQKKLPAIPKIADMESSQQPADNKELPPSDAKKKPSAGRLALPVTTLMGKASAPPPDDNNTPAEQKVDKALAEQKDLLAEFQKIADELNNLLANLEGSTLVKRLKAASRTQYKIAGGINRQLGDTFGKAEVRALAKPEESLAQLGDQELKSSLDVSYIMDDMQAYFERRRLMAFKTILDDMRSQDVLGSLRRVADDIKKEQGLSLSQCEYWSDVLDRWAEDLVEAAGCCCCKGGSRSSVPPALVLEVLQILEGEINLREDTRVTEQAKAATAAEVHRDKAGKLSKTQSELADRVEKVVEQLRELPKGEEEFAPEIGMLSQVNGVMKEASQILGQPDTGSPAIAAETEAIELLLRSKRINPKAGGGGGATPGGGGKGDTTDLAVMLSGSGQNDKEVREDRGVSQSLGKSGPALPEEFRAGLNEYFNRLEARKE